ncbi:cytochrome c oxidase assembly protein subunit 15 [Haloferula luteola]|uniref:Cytochrome c oxidase assembly protein subunit 15 n=1 Tax=Haloferula luteola TaxID=595692 RepID=A0A840VA83_9BACT|nr:COX15/CtaA family protein [Haloferula luteola]MBB5349821.1 cytochrome c oxidase assembly protein subunit 15 [Haloferula luteola]
MNRFQKLALASLVSVLVLIFVGAVVRVTGAGLGCPDWPTCWGCLVPPWKVEQVDLSKIDFEKFRAKAERLGRDPDTVTPEHILESFNPRHVWTEFVNRLTSLPVGIFAVATLVASWGRSRAQKAVKWTAMAALIVVLINAVMGAKVVYSGLKPGILTAHMALAMLLIVLQVFTLWRGTDQPMRLHTSQQGAQRGWIGVGILLGAIVIEGIMGSQIRELTDQMAKSHQGQDRVEWISELEQSWIYLVHRSFSWVIVVVTAISWAWTRKNVVGPIGKAPRWVVGLVALQMLLGLVMAQVEVHEVAQVLHVGLAGILLAATVHWFLTLLPSKAETAGH